MKGIPVVTTELGAVGFALAAYTCWVLADTSLKIAGRSALPAYEILALIGTAEVVLLLLIGGCRGNLATLRPKQPGRQLLRSGLDLANNLCVVVALRHLPLALFYILIFVAPIVTTLLSAAFLHERLEWKRSVAILAGFAGVVIAVDPVHGFRSGDAIGYLACLVCVACFSVNIVWSRVLTQTETPESLTFASGALMVVAGGVGMMHRAAWPEARAVALLSATGLFCIVGSYCFFLALRSAAAATVSQFHYSQLITGAGLAWLIWRERLTGPMLCGAVLIIGAGVYTAAASYHAKQRRGALAFAGAEPAP